MDEKVGSWDINIYDSKGFSLESEISQYHKKAFFIRGRIKAI